MIDPKYPNIAVNQKPFKVPKTLFYTITIIGNQNFHNSHFESNTIWTSKTRSTNGVELFIDRESLPYSFQTNYI